MSHDRGCFVCFDDDKKDCGKRNCPYQDKPLKGKTMIENKEVEDDFGFTFSDSNEIQNQIKSNVEDKAQGLRKMIMPLLNNLMKNPEKDTIVWPNREKKIKDFIKKMDDYINS